MIQPKLHDDHYLKVHVDVLDLVSFVTLEVVLDFLALNVVKLANLVKGIHRDLLEAFTMLLRRQQSQLVIDVSDEV
jgi:hypothetical protein